MTSVLDRHCRQGQGSVDTGAVAVWGQTTMSLAKCYLRSALTWSSARDRQCLAAEAFHISLTQLDSHVSFSVSATAAAAGGSV